MMFLSGDGRQPLRREHAGQDSDDIYTQAPMIAYYISTLSQSLLQIMVQLPRAASIACRREASTAAVAASHF